MWCLDRESLKIILRVRGTNEGFVKSRKRKQKLQKYFFRSNNSLRDFSSLLLDVCEGDNWLSSVVY